MFIKEVKEIIIPSTLRAVRPFLYEALKYLRLINNKQNTFRYKRITLSCINAAFKLNAFRNHTTSEPEIKCLDLFSIIRNKLAVDLNLSDDEIQSMISFSSKKKEEISTLELFVAEADTMLYLADEQLQLDLTHDALYNYHAACVFYRVMEPMIPPAIASIQNSKLIYAAEQIKKFSSYEQNMILQNMIAINFEEKYHLYEKKLLGSGTYGSVYLATHHMTGIQRAVKVLDIERITSYNLRKVHNEIMILRSLDHPNIIKLHDVFISDRQVFIVTDFCSGGQLYDRINSASNFDENQVKKMTNDMLSAVNYLHRNGIVHRDIKLENFLLADSSHDSRLILIDFGLSKHIDDGEQLNQIVGSCYYTAPEVLNRCYDTKCDIWSIGIICYMILSGSSPFGGNTVDEIYADIQSRELIFNSKQFQVLTPNCLDFLKQILIKDPKHRLSSSDALHHSFIAGKCLNRLQQDFGKLPIIHSPTKFKKNTHNNSQGIFPRKEKIIVY